MRISVLACSFVLAACSGGTTDTPGSAFDQLGNATFKSILDEPVTLAGGRFEGEPFTADSASRPVVTLLPGTMAKGDLTGDGRDEAVVALAYNASGSGVFVYLAVVRDEDGRPDNVATIGLGDRVRITGLEIADGRIVADLVEHAPDDPMCCPTKAVRRQWSLEDGEPILLEPAAGAAGDRVRGHLVWGQESRSFTECGGAREAWVINDAGDELVDVYNELTTAPYQPMFVEVRGFREPAPGEGFGADYDEALRITELLRAENEGFGCRLVLDGVLFVASGNEPSWRLQVREDGLFLRSMGAPDEVAFAAPEIRGRAPLVSFESGGPDSRIKVTLEQRRCVDTMSGARYAWSASVEIDGRQLTGCAAQGL